VILIDSLKLNQYK